MLPIHRLWTDEEYEKLKEFSARGYTSMQAAIALRRNRNAVAAKAREIGFPLLTIVEGRKLQKQSEIKATGDYKGRWNSY